MAEKFSKKEAINFGWNIMRENLKFFVILMIICFLIHLVLGGISDFLEDDYSVLSFIVSVIGWILSTIISLGLIKIALNLLDNKEGKLSDLFSQLPLFFKYLFSNILYGLIIFVGFILLIIPGIILAVKYQFFVYFIVDKNAGPIEALKRSSEITRGAKWDLFLFGLLLGFINFLGALCLIIGLFATVPITMIASAFVYRKLLSHIENVSPAKSSDYAEKEAVS